jgi:hypothetical protein
MTIVDACLSLMSTKCKIEPKQVRLIAVLIDGLYAPESRMDRALESYFIYIYIPLYLFYISLSFLLFFPPTRGGRFLIHKSKTTCG